MTASVSSIYSTFGLFDGSQHGKPSPTQARSIKSKHIQSSLTIRPLEHLQNVWATLIRFLCSTNNHHMTSPHMALPIYGNHQRLSHLGQRRGFHYHESVISSPNHVVLHWRLGTGAEKRIKARVWPSSPRVENYTSQISTLWFEFPSQQQQRCSVLLIFLCFPCAFHSPLEGWSSSVFQYSSRPKIPRLLPPKQAIYKTRDHHHAPCPAHAPALSSLI